MAPHTCHSKTWEVETGGSGVQGQPELYNQTVLKKNCQKRTPKLFKKILWAKFASFFGVLLIAFEVEAYF